MKIVGFYSFNGGAEAVQKKYVKELDEVKQVLISVDAKKHKTKRSEEKTMRDKVLYSPRSLNKEISDRFLEIEWEKKRVLCDYPRQYYSEGYEPHRISKGAFREMDFC